MECHGWPWYSGMGCLEYTLVVTWNCLGRALWVSWGCLWGTGLMGGLGGVIEVL